jgi:hypothetical protein
VEVSTKNNCVSPKRAVASNLNRHGASLQLNSELKCGSTVLIRNMTGTQLAARVVGQNNAEGSLHTYGIEFLDSGDRAARFWGIAFPSKVGVEKCGMKAV